MMHVNGEEAHAITITANMDKKYKKNCINKKKKKSMMEIGKSANNV